MAQFWRLLFCFVLGGSCNRRTKQIMSSVVEGFLGLLDLKKEAVVGLDGQTIMLKTDDFIGIRDIPVHSSRLHLATARSQMNATVSVGFFFQNGNLIRKYNPKSEEISTETVDELTIQNLLNQVQQITTATSTEDDDNNNNNNKKTGNNPISEMMMTRILPYPQIVSQQQQKQWLEQTCYISSTNILNRRNIGLGSKIVPGSFLDDALSNQPFPSSTSSSNDQHIPDGDPSAKSFPQHQNSDGISISYPPIPVISDDSFLSNSSLSSSSSSNLPQRTKKMVQHLGYKRYLSTLTPSERTKLFVSKGSSSSSLASFLLEDILSKYYDSDYRALLGDLQLAYILVLNLQCFASLEHWRDLIAMLSLVDEEGIRANSHLYQNLIMILPAQISRIDKSFLEDIDQAGNNFLIPALQSLLRKLTASRLVFDDPDSINKFQRLLTNHFPNSFHLADSNMECVEGIDAEHIETSAVGGSYNNSISSRQRSVTRANFDDESDNDEEGPVIVAMEDVRASLERSSGTHNKNPRNDIPHDIQSHYPVLVAAIQQHEDILMTCARALDEKKDVSLVREAAAYLEETERRREL